MPRPRKEIVDNSDSPSPSHETRTIQQTLIASGKMKGKPVSGFSASGETPFNFLCPAASHHRNRESLVRRQAAERHLEDGGIYRKRWWACVALEVP